MRNAVFPAGGVMIGGVGGGVTPRKASAGGAVIPANNARASAAMPALITFESPKTRFGCNLLQFISILLIEVCGISRTGNNTPGVFFFPPRFKIGRAHV